MGNKYVNRSRISEAKFRELVKLFVLDLTATQIAELSGLNRNTVNRYITGIRQQIADYCEASFPFPLNSGFKRVKELNQKCVGVSESQGRICTVLFERKEAMDDIKSNGPLTSHLDLIIDIEKSERIWCPQSDRSKKKSVDGFWGYLKTRLEKFKGIHSQTYFLHLKESEFRFNKEKDELYQLILKIIRNKPLF